MKDKRLSQNIHTNLALTDAISSRNPSVVDKSRKAYQGFAGFLIFIRSCQKSSKSSEMV